MGILRSLRNMPLQDGILRSLRSVPLNDGILRSLRSIPLNDGILRSLRSMPLNDGILRSLRSSDPLEIDTWNIDDEKEMTYKDTDTKNDNKSFDLNTPSHESCSDQLG